jgi:hypothetical protein
LAKPRCTCASTCARARGFAKEKARAAGGRAGAARARDRSPQTRPRARGSARLGERATTRLEGDGLDRVDQARAARDEVHERRLGLIDLEAPARRDAAAELARGDGLRRRRLH